MKKIFASTALLAIFAINVHAQKTSSAEKTNGLHFGIKAGLNLANIVKTDDNNFSTQLKPGLNAGVFLELPIINGFSVQPEVFYSQKGYKTSGSTVVNGPYEYNITSNFIDVPILARFAPSKSFAILAGPQYSFLMSTKTKFTSTNTTYQNLVENDNNNLKKNIFGGVIGFEAGTEAVIFSARYNIDFQQNNGDGSSTTPKYKNQLFAIGIGIRL